MASLFDNKSGPLKLIVQYGSGACNVEILAIIIGQNEFWLAQTSGAKKTD